MSSAAPGSCGMVRSSLRRVFRPSFSSAERVQSSQPQFGVSAILSMYFLYMYGRSAGSPSSATMYAGMPINAGHEKDHV